MAKLGATEFISVRIYILVETCTRTHMRVRTYTIDSRIYSDDLARETRDIARSPRRTATTSSNVSRRVTADSLIR